MSSWLVILLLYLDVASGTKIDNAFALEILFIILWVIYCSLRDHSLEFLLAFLVSDKETRGASLSQSEFWYARD